MKPGHHSKINKKHMTRHWGVEFFYHPTRTRTNVPRINTFNEKWKSYSVLDFVSGTCNIMNQATDQIDLHGSLTTRNESGTRREKIFSGPESPKCSFLMISRWLCCRKVPERPSSAQTKKSSIVKDDF